MTRLERNMRLFRVLRILEKAYERADFREFISLLAEDCVYESMWVLEPLRGREAVSKHLLRKGRSIKKSKYFPSCRIAELVGNMNPLPESDTIVNGEKKRAAIALAYEAGKYCLMVSQVLNGEINEVSVVLELAEDGKVGRIDLCMPELFNRSDTHYYVVALPANGAEENEDALIRIREECFSELSLFLLMAGEGLDELDDLVVPMENWVKALDFWKDFVEATDYDAFVEKAAGIDYDYWILAKDYVLDMLSRDGVSLWKNRKDHAVMLEGLLEWTQKYMDSYDCIHTHDY